MLTLSEAIDAYLTSQSRRLSAGTIRAYGHSLRRLSGAFEDDTDITNIERSDMIRWLDGLYGDLSVYTVKGTVTDAKTFFNWLVNVGFISASPLAGVKNPKPAEVGPKALSVEDFDRLLEEAAFFRGSQNRIARAMPARNVAILLFLASTGCRVGGLVTARLSTFDLVDDGAITEVTEKGRGGGKTRTVYLSETAALAVLEWLDYRPATEHDCIFTVLQGPTAGNPLHPREIRKLLARLAKRAGVEGRFNPHSFRHACARQWIKNGADLSTVSRLLGHTDIRVTAKYYARWSDTELRDIHQRVDWTDSE